MRNANKIAALLLLSLFVVQFHQQLLLKSVKLIAANLKP